MNSVENGLSIINAVINFIKNIWTFLTTPLTQYIKDVPLLSWLADILEWIADNLDITLTPIGLLTVSTVGIFILVKILQLFKGD